RAPNNGGPAAAKAYPNDCAMPESRADTDVLAARNTNHIMTKLNAKPVPRPNRMTAGTINCISHPIISTRLATNISALNHNSGRRSLSLTMNIGPINTIGSWVNCTKESTHPDSPEGMPQLCSTTGSHATAQ